MRAHDAPLVDVLVEVGRACRIEIAGQQASQRISTDFDDLPLSEALSRLLRGQSYAVIYGSAGRILGVRILERSLKSSASDSTSLEPPPTAVLQVKTVQTAAQAPSDPQAEPIAVPIEPMAVPMERTVPVGAALASALGNVDVTAQDLMVAALSQEEDAVREAAQIAFLNTLNSDPEMEAAYSAALEWFDDATMAQLLRRTSSDRSPEDLMARLADGARSPELRAKASAVIEELHRLSGN